MKKLFKYAMLLMAVGTMGMSLSSCSSDDDDKVVALATQVIGTYEGNEIVTVMGDESSNGTATYEFAKSTDSAIDMTIPEMGGMGPMSIPKLLVKGIMLTEGNKTITGRLASFSGTVKAADGSEKAYTVSDIVVLFNEKNVVVTFSVKYGNMPFAMVTNFTGTKK